MTTAPAVSTRAREGPVAHRRIAVLVGVLFLSFTVALFIGNSLIYSLFFSVNRHDGTFITGVLLLVLSGLADVAVGVAMGPGLLWVKRRPPRDRQRGRAG